MKAVDAKAEELDSEGQAGNETPPRKENSATTAPAVGSRRVLMVAGGTGGHIYPALAVARELRERASRAEPGAGFQVMFLGTNRELESRLIPAAGFPLRKVPAAGLKGVGGWRRIQNLLVLPRTAVETALVLREFSPDVVVGIGGYLAGPAVLQAALKDIPTLLIEPNAVPGFTNRVLAPVVRLAAVATEEAASLYGTKARLTGQPVRKEFARLMPKAHESPFTVFIIGGSQGSAAINQCVMKSLSRLENRAAELRFIHQTGERDYNAVRRAYAEEGLSAEIHGFVEDVPGMFARADLVISRAGATAVAELAAAGKAALLIPFPAATDHHQLENARAMERAGAAQVLEQARLTPERLVEAIFNLLERPERLVEMERAARRRARPDAAERIATLIEDLGKRG